MNLKDLYTSLEKTSDFLKTIRYDELVKQFNVQVKQLATPSRPGQPPLPPQGQIFTNIRKVLVEIIDGLNLFKNKKYNSVELEVINRFNYDSYIGEDAIDRFQFYLDIATDNQSLNDSKITDYIRDALAFAVKINSFYNFRSSF